MKKLAVFFLSVLVSSSCNKDCDFVGTYIFELPATLSPARDTFRVGDTITITSEFSDMVFERKTNKTYMLENWQFYPNTGIYRIDTIEQPSKFYGYFDLLIDSTYQYNVQQFSEGDQFLVGQYLYKEKKYHLQFSLILRQKGLFSFSHVSLLGALGKNQTFDGECPKRKAGLDAAVKLNSGADNNIRMLSSSPDPHYHDWLLQKPDERFHKFGGYCFYVKE